MRTAKFYRKNEAETMRTYGLRPTVNSGSGWIEKEDGENEKVIAQLKSTDAQSISVKLLDLEKLNYHAAVSHKIPVFIIQFLGENQEYFLCKPEHLVELATALRTNGSETIQVIDKNALQSITEPLQSKSEPTKIISSGSSQSRSKFYADREKQWRKNK